MHKKHQDHQRVGTWLCRALALFMAIGFTTAWAHVAIQADTVLIHGHITTMDPANPQVQALALRDGRVLAMGSDASVKALQGKTTRVIDLQGRRVIPGVHGGYSLQITFANPIDADFLEAWENHPELTGFERKNNGIVQLTLRHQSASIERIERAMQLGEIAEFRGGTLSLHEIYLRALNPRSGNKKPALVSV